MVRNRTPRRRTAPYSPYNPRTPTSAVRSAMSAVATARRAWDRINTGTNTEGTSGRNNAGVTFQHDSRVVWKKKKPNKKRARRNAKFTKKVRRVINKDLGKQTIIINGSATVDPITTGQGFTEVNLYSANGSSGFDPYGDHDKDLILNEASNRRTENDSAGIEYISTIDSSEKSRKAPTMVSARMDVTWTNIGDTSLEADLYIIKHRNVKDERTYKAIGDTTWDNELATRLEYRLASGSALTNQGTNPTLVTRGVTPFDLPGLKLSGAKIMSKTKFFISPGNSITKQFDHGKTGKLSPHTATTGSRYDKDTMTYLMVAKNTRDVIGAEVGRFTCRYTKRYSWVQHGVKDPKISVLPLSVVTDTFA